MKTTADRRLTLALACTLLIVASVRGAEIKVATSGASPAAYPSIAHSDSARGVYLSTALFPTLGIADQIRG